MEPQIATPAHTWQGFQRFLNYLGLDRPLRVAAAD
jgi:hypothetical protein